MGTTHLSDGLKKIVSFQWNLKISKSVYLIGLMGVSFFWKLYYINTRDISLDEPFSIFHAQMDLTEIFRILIEGNNPPFFEFILHFWIKLFGIESYFVRLLPLIFHTLTIYFLFKIGSVFSNKYGGLISSLIFILSTFHFYYALEARVYSFVSFATSGSLYYFLHFINKEINKKHFILLSVFNLLLVYAHYFGWFIIFNQVILAVWIKRKNSKFFLLCLLTTIVLYAPLWFILINRFLVSSSEGTWVQPPHPSHYQWFLELFLNHNYYFILGLITVGLFLNLIFFFYGRKGLTMEYKILLPLFLWWFLPYTIMFFVSFKVPMFIDRYILFNSIGLFCFVGLLLSELYKRTKFLSAVVVMMVAYSFYKNLQINAKDFYYREVNRSVSKVKELKNEHEKTIVIIHPYWADIGFMYYYDRDLFRNYKNFDSNKSNNKIFPVWNLQNCKEVVERYPDHNIVFYQDGKNSGKAIMDFLEEDAELVEENLFPECHQVNFYRKTKSSY